MSACIGVLPMGRVPEAACRAVEGHLKAFFGLHVDTLTSQAEPAYAHDPNRMQYNAAAILTRLESTRFPHHDKILAVLNVDLFIPVFTHVFGEAREGGKCALVSMFRLRDGRAGGRAEADRIMERLVKVAVHEMAHLFDLVHCMESRCLMHFSMNLDMLDTLPIAFCPVCEGLLASSIRRVGRQS